MNALRWIFGFPLATALSTGLLYISTEFGVRGIYSSHLYFLIQFFQIITSVFCLSTWVFLTCFFIPYHKKIAGLVPAVLAFVLIAAALVDDIKNHRISLIRTYAMPIAVVFISLFCGYVVSYLVFKGKGWGRLKQSPAKELHELYPY